HRVDLLLVAVLFNGCERNQRSPWRRSRGGDWPRDFYRSGPGGNRLGLLPAASACQHLGSDWVARAGLSGADEVDARREGEGELVIGLWSFCPATQDS